MRTEGSFGPICKAFSSVIAGSTMLLVNGGLIPSFKGWKKESQGKSSHMKWSTV